MIDLLLLGAGAMMPLPDRWLSALLVRYGGNLILFDCGEGTQIVWRRFGWGFRGLSTICLTHWHADHVAGLPGLLHTVANADRTEPIAIHGPVGTRRVVDGLRVIAPHLPFSVEVFEHAAGDRFNVGEALVVRAIAAEHRVPCLGYRVDLPRARRFRAERARALGVPIQQWRQLQRGEPVVWDGGSASPDDLLGPPRPGLSFGFVTDTRPLPSMMDDLRGVNLLICEGTYGDPNDAGKAVENKHMTFGEAATIARDAGVAALWLTHFSPAMTDPTGWLPKATAVFPNVTIGRSGLTTTLSFADEAAESEDER